MIAPSKELRRINREIVSAVVVSADDCLLFGKKDAAKGGVYSECWHLPGGGTDGEELLTALGRELGQEIHLLSLEGLDVKLLDDKGTGSSRKALPDGEVVICDMRFNVYQVNLQESSTNATVRPGSDLIELRWVPRSELKDLEMTPPSRELFARLGWLNR